MMLRLAVFALCLFAGCSALDLQIKLSNQAFHPNNVTITNPKSGDSIVWNWQFDPLRRYDVKQAKDAQDWQKCIASGTEFGTDSYYGDTYTFTFNSTNNYARTIYFFTSTNDNCINYDMRGAVIVHRTDVVGTTGFQTTEVQTTGVQTTASTTASTTDVRTTGIQTSGVQTTEVQTTVVQTTAVPTTTDVQTTGFQTTEVQTTRASNVTTGVQTTMFTNMTTGFQTTEVQTTVSQSTAVIQTTLIQTTLIQTTGGVPANATTGDSSVITVCKMIVATCVIIAAML